MGIKNLTEVLLGEDRTTLQDVISNDELILIIKTIDDLSNNIGADHIHFKVRNVSGDTIPKGSVVTGSSTQSGTDYIEIKLRTTTNETALGIVHADIPNNGTGLVINKGISADEVNTSAWNEGTVLYPNTSGGLTSTKPTTGVYQACALVTRKHQTQGTLLLDFSNPQAVEGDFVRSNQSDTVSGTLLFTNIVTQLTHRNPTDNSDTTIGFEDDYLRYRFGTTNTTLGIRLDSYDTPVVYLNRFDASWFEYGISTNDYIEISHASPYLRLTETDTSVSSRFVLSGGDLYIQSGDASSGQDILFTGMNSVDLGGDLKVRKSGVYQTLLHTGNLDIIHDTTPQLGGDLDCNGNTINKSAVRQITDASYSGGGTYTFNYANGDMQQLTLTGSTTIAFSNMPSGAVSGFIIDAVNWGAYTITHPTGMLFAGGTAPTYTASGTDRLLVTRDKDGVYTLTVVAQDIKVVA